MIVTTGNDVDGYRVTQYLGVVRGLVVRAPGVTEGFMGALRAIGGGNIQEFIAVCEAARRQAFDEMVAHAQQLGADAIIAMRYDANDFMQGTTEVLAYGTAVKLAERPSP